MENFDNNELYHYGRKGMKWGQNIFGSDKGSGGSKGGAKKKTTLKGVIKKLEAKKKARDKAKAKEAAKKQAEAEAKAKVDVENRRREVAKSRSAQKVYENAHLFTTQELNDIYYRLNLERNIKNLIPEKGKKGKKVADDIIDWTGKADKFIANGKKLYNHFATIYNSFNKQGNSIPLIKAKPDERKNNDDNDSNDNDSKGFGSEKKTSAGKRAFSKMFSSFGKKNSGGSDDDTIYVRDEDIEIITPSSSKNKASAWTSNTSARSAGESYISQYLSLPAPKDDD